MAERDRRGEAARGSFAPASAQGLPRGPRVYSRDFLDAFWGPGVGARELPPIDLSEDDEHYVVTAELPGMKAEDLRVELEGGALTIRGEKKLEREVTRERCRTLERWFGAFERTVRLPPDAGGEPVQAVLEGGVLTVTIAKRPRQSARAVEIEVP
jgi:HSP20 family protein